jgi:cobalamin biosynthesis protein CobT
MPGESDLYPRADKSLTQLVVLIYGVVFSLSIAIEIFSRLVRKKQLKASFQQARDLYFRKQPETQMEYDIFTKQFDQVRHVSDEMWTDKTVSLMAPRQLSFLDTMGKGVDLSGLQFSAEGPDPVFLLDCSGSMRGHRMYNAAFALRAVGDALHEAGRNFEMLGFTTVNWKGGESRKLWLNERRPRQPGRLNDLLHIVIKGMDEPWEAARQNLAYLLREGLLKENIDGEAYAWARERIQGRSGEQVLIPISDGAPMDDSTLSVNPVDLLKNHLQDEELALVKTGISTKRVFIERERGALGILPEVIHVDPVKGPQSFVDAIA